MRIRCGLPVALMAGVLMAGCGAASHAEPSRGVTPSASLGDAASPEDVVRAYVSAVNTRDCATASSLAADADAWCGRSTLNDLRITRTSDQTRAGEPSRKVKQVTVEFTLRGGDASMPEGPHTWGYLLDRTGPHDAWRIYDQGVG